MLNSNLLCILLAINSALPMKKDIKMGKKPPFPKQTNCETMKCPAMEQPICAKLVYKNPGNKTVHVVMVNKCEMNYVKCHEGLEAVVVPMKSCSHNHFIKSGSKRSKREVGDSKQQLRQLKKQALQANQNKKGHSGAKIVLIKEKRIYLSEPQEHLDAEYDPEEQFDVDEYNNGEEADVNLVEYISDCPSVCPARDVMVCARCQHGVFRTFISVCHMRMFACQHNDESLELIARSPCVMSAPYLSEASMQPSGRIHEPSDDDRVLRYLRCRDLSEMSRESDPRCKFMNNEDTKMMTETLNDGDDDY